MTSAKDVLKQLLTVLNTQPKTLTDDERWLAGKIKHCSKCNNFWVAKTRHDPPRCPACHRRGWNRPLLDRMTEAQRQTQDATQRQQD